MTEPQGPPEQPAGMTPAVVNPQAHPHLARQRLTDTQALALLAAWFVFRQITSRLGIALTARRAFRVSRPWLIPLLSNLPPQLIIAGTGASGSWPKIIATVFTSVLMSTIVGLIFYWAGWRFGHKLADMAKRPGSPMAGIWNPKQIARAERWMDRWGVIVVFLGRATEHFTLPITLVAGASEMRLRRFLAAQIAGGIAFAGLFLWIGSVAHRRFPGVERFISTTYVTWAFRIGIAALVLLALAWVLGRFVPQKDAKGEAEGAGEDTEEPAAEPAGEVAPPTTEAPGSEDRAPDA